MSTQITVSPRHIPELDPGFVPASLWTARFMELCQEHGSREIKIAVMRPDGSGSTHHDTVLPAEEEWEALNLRHIERVIKFLLWGCGGSGIMIAGAPELAAPLQAIYSPSGARAFDADFIRKVFSAELLITSVEEADYPQIAATTGPKDGAIDMKGNRIGFDLGGSDRKCAAVIDGEVVFSEEIAWDPYFEKDPNYHREGIIDSLKRAAAHLPKVDCIGGSAAGVYVNNKVRVASLFRGVPDELFADHVENIFIEIAKDWDNVPICVVNDGDVTALAGAISLKDGAVLGLAMGTSAAGGYANDAGTITNWLSELAFVPVDYREEAPADEWSGDGGCGVQYFSQQAVSRLLPASGLDIDPELDKPEKLVEVQKLMEEGNDQAAAIYRSIGVYLGYAIPQFARFYEIRHLLLMGRVLSGKGGDLIIEHANAVLRDEFPELASKVEVTTPDEKMKRHGQAIAAASLPRLD